MAAPNSEIAETTPPPGKTKPGDVTVPKDAPVSGSGVEPTSLTPALVDWQHYTPGRPKDATVRLAGNDLTWSDPAHKGTEGSTDAQTAAWLFGKSDTPGGKNNDLKVSKVGPDGTPVSVDATPTRVSADAGVAHIEHSAKDGTNIYKSDAYTATDTNGVRTITDSKTGYTVTWDSKSHHGELLDKDHKVRMKFDSEDEYKAKVEHTLTADRSVSQFTNKEAMDASVQKYLDARKAGTTTAQGERIFVDSKGDYSIVAKDGVMYEYDQASGKIFATKDGNRVEVPKGSTFQDVAGNTTVTADGVIKVGPTQLDTNHPGTLTTQSDTGAVTVTAGNGQSVVTNPEVAATTLTDKGTITNGEQRTQSVFAQADTQGNVNGSTTDGASYSFNNNGLVVNEANGQYTMVNDNGTVCAYAPDGTQLFDTNQNGGVDVLSQPLDVSNDPLDADNSGDGSGGDGSDQSGGGNGVAATTAISTFAGAGSDITQAGDAHLDPAKAMDVSNRLMTDYSRLTQFSAEATARGMDWAAAILDARAASALEAANNILANERVAKMTARNDQADGLSETTNTPHRRDVSGTVSDRTNRQDQDI
jgi:hypothetical protein